MAGPQFAAVIDGLVTTLRAATGLGAPGDGSGDVPVYDGPVPTNAPVMHFVAVGWDGDDTSDSTAAEWESEWAGMGNGGARDETGTVSCVVIAGDGSDDFPAIRTTALATLATIAAALAAAPAVGAAPTVLWTELNTGAMQQGVSASGAFVRLAFTVGYAARI